MTLDVNLRDEIQTYEVGCIGAALLDAELQIIAVSEGVLAISGHDGTSLVGRSALEVVHPDDIERAAEALAEAISTPGPSAEGMYRLRFNDATYHDFSVAATSLGPARGNTSVFQFRPVPMRLRAEEFARDTVDAMRMLAESHTINDCLERVHQLAERHIPGAVLVITTSDDSGAMHSHRRSTTTGSFVSEERDSVVPIHVQEAFEDHLRGPWRSFSRMASFERIADGGKITSVLTDDNDRLLGFVDAVRPNHDEPDDHEWMVHGLIRQVLTALLRRVRLDEQLRQAAERDPLTGLANRRRLFSDMAEHGELEDTALLLLDVDRFSWINNTLGHHVGDEALVSLATGLVAICPPDATIVRFGGDEFVIWAPTRLDDLNDLAETIRTHGFDTQTTPEAGVALKCSIGAVRIKSGETPTDAIKRADEAMYVAKRRGGDGIHIA